MIKTFVTLMFVSVCGFYFAFNDYKKQKRKYEKYILQTKSHRKISYNQPYYNRDLLQRRGAWRFGVNNLLFDNELSKKRNEESNIKVK